METNTAEVTNEESVQETTKDKAETKARRPGRPSDPNSSFNKAKRIMESLPADQLKVKNVVQLIVEATDAKPGTAQVYFYTIKKTMATRSNSEDA